MENSSSGDGGSEESASNPFAALPSFVAFGSSGSGGGSSFASVDFDFGAFSPQDASASPRQSLGVFPDFTSAEKEGSGNGADCEQPRTLHDMMRGNEERSGSQYDVLQARHLRQLLHSLLSGGGEEGVGETQTETVEWEESGGVEEMMGLIKEAAAAVQKSGRFLADSLASAILSYIICEGEEAQHKELLLTLLLLCKEGAITNPAASPAAARESLAVYRQMCPDVASSAHWSNATDVADISESLTTNSPLGVALEKDSRLWAFRAIDEWLGEDKAPLYSACTGGGVEHRQHHGPLIFTAALFCTLPALLESSVGLALTAFGKWSVASFLVDVAAVDQVPLLWDALLQCHGLLPDSAADDGDCSVVHRSKLCTILHEGLLKSALRPLARSTLLNVLLHMATTVPEWLYPTLEEQQCGIDIGVEAMAYAPTEAVYRLLSCSPFAEMAATENGRATVLYAAIQHSRWDVAEELLSRHSVADLLAGGGDISVPLLSFMQADNDTIEWMLTALLGKNDACPRSDKDRALIYEKRTILLDAICASAHNDTRIGTILDILDSCDFLEKDYSRTVIVTLCTRMDPSGVDVLLDHIPHRCFLFSEPAPLLKEMFLSKSYVAATHLIRELPQVLDCLPESIIDALGEPRLNGKRLQELLAALPEEVLLQHSRYGRNFFHIAATSTGVDALEFLRKTLPPSYVSEPDAHGKLPADYLRRGDRAEMRRIPRRRDLVPIEAAVEENALRRAILTAPVMAKRA